MIKPHRSHPLWIAYLLHRLSGLGLALFLPAHFYLLAMALNQPQTFDELLRFADNPLVKLAEFGLVFLLAVHVFGGLRLLALEFLPWSPRQKTMAASAVAAAFLVAGAFFLQAV
ncbi:succinate dehydrogenase, cytochrome b556 subunit [Hoeflea sp. G2-23]|uniref:Succinate dehydrogenase cytochrome b556 subunit n=1 Tax=Hoeflea algicola TaxID=2983763 RepID=A0ABT3Z535_9HYPH|nr:succinate dehydrogenase, cytochrome b556 subunit [Hoeflea algicola]MCY0146860.1 succinate dehydrogenase, cytochrome b556 subunit [Hoeflea algicola]